MTFSQYVKQNNAGDEDRAYAEQVYQNAARFASSSRFAAAVFGNCFAKAAANPARRVVGQYCIGESLVSARAISLNRDAGLDREATLKKLALSSPLEVAAVERVLASTDLGGQLRGDWNDCMYGRPR